MDGDGDGMVAASPVPGPAGAVESPAAAATPGTSRSDRPDGRSRPGVEGDRVAVESGVDVAGVPGAGVDGAGLGGAGLGGAGVGGPGVGGPGVDGAGRVVVGPDGLARCPWGLSAPDYVAYHDNEWGRQVRDTVGLFERLSLEAFQSGLSWLTILRKRDGFRRAFAGFEPKVVAGFGPPDVERLLADAAIVRNRRKIEAVVTNARAVLALGRPLGDLVWSYRPEPAPAAVSLAELPATTPESVALAKALKKAGFVFLGPTTVYALMQACGLVDDHLAGCHARGVAERAGSDSAE